jgi:sulfopyruvate decarboxylase subunit alpha
MEQVRQAPPSPAARIEGAAIVEAIKRAGVEFVVSVPDRVTSETVLRPIAADPGLRLVRVCKEDEGVSICAALSFCDKRALLLMQQTGLLDSLNALRGIGVEYSLPVVMMVGLLGHESDSRPASSAKYGVRIIEPVLDAMGVAHEFLHAAGDETRITAAIDRAYASGAPLALLIGRTPA